jgi:hypothetical protein
MQWADWVHVIVVTYGTWLPGDRRGFRDHGHRIHSSGTRASPPPPGEHVGLHRYSMSIVGEEVHVAQDLRLQLVAAIVGKLEACSVPVRIAAMCKTHGHVLARVGRVDAKPIVGRAKQAASHAVRHRMPGSIWAQGCHVVRIGSEEQYRAVVEYIAAHREDGGAVWEHPRWRR